MRSLKLTDMRPTLNAAYLSSQSAAEGTADPGSRAASVRKGRNNVTYVVGGFRSLTGPVRPVDVLYRVDLEPTC
jgi:hypothetical protein